MIESITPKYLYKIIPFGAWKSSQGKECVQLSSADHEFVHLSTEEQLGRLIAKYWANVPDYVVLKVEVSKLPGNLVLEANPGGTNKYYHLYNGFIPIEAVVDSKAFRQDISCDLCEE